jgi:hypothetical protein
VLAQSFVNRSSYPSAAINRLRKCEDQAPFELPTPQILQSIDIHSKKRVVPDAELYKFTDS